MMRSMFAAISGLKNHQTMMDVVGNNIANVNTTGFKQSRVTFQDILSQTVRGASGPQGGRGGVNAEQVGLGVILGGIDTIQSQGTLQSTGKSTDMAIQGDGYFVMNDGKSDSYSRDGSFDLGTDGTLVNPATGMHVMGWQASPLTGVVNSTVPPTVITIPIGGGMTGKVSSNLTVTGNLDAGTAAAGTYDSKGNAMPITLTATKLAGLNAWSIVPTTVLPNTVAGTNPVTFNASGKVALPVGQFGVPLVITIPGPTGPSETVTFDMSQITQLAGSSSMSSTTDGATAGSLTSFTVGKAGDITGIYSNGYKQPLGQMALATFANPSGLLKTGGNMFTSSPNSGTPNIGTPSSNGRGDIATGFLEGSNVDLAQQFTNMIMAERGFQANSKVITTSDEILQDLVNLKH
jgi:flagellar hook protein FlgE